MVIEWISIDWSADRASLGLIPNRRHVERLKRLFLLDLTLKYVLFVDLKYSVFIACLFRRVARVSGERTWKCQEKEQRDGKKVGSPVPITR